MQKSSDVNNNPLQWDDVRYFFELARMGSLSGAARKLNVEHSTVARRVEALESSLGVKLFDRLPKAWLLTEEGEALSEQASRLADEAQAFSRAALGVSSLQGTVTISAPPILSSHLLVPALAEIPEQWENINLELIGDVQDANIARGEADLAIRLSRPTAAGLSTRLIGEMHFSLYGTRHYIERPEDQWEFLGHCDSLKKAPQQQWLEHYANGRRFNLKSNDIAALLHAAKTGLGLALLPNYLAKNDDHLIALNLPNTSPAITRQLWLVTHPDVQRSPRVRRVIDTLVLLLQNKRDLLE